MGGSKPVLGNATNGESNGYLDSGPSLCAVFLKESVDLFGQRQDGGTGIWCVGNYLTKKPKGIASVRLIDQSEEDIAEEDIQMLTRDELVDAIGQEARFGCDALTVIENPEELELGDLVYGEFQKGQNVECWTQATKVLFRGRVTLVDPSKKTCDICYDDGDYETSVPYAHVIRIVLNEHKIAWINGISVTKESKSKRTGATAEEATIVVDEDYKPRLQYSTSNEKWQNKISLKKALQLVFMQALAYIPLDRRLSWPQDIAASTLKRQSPSAAEKQVHTKKKAKELADSSKESKPSRNSTPPPTFKTPIKQDSMAENTTQGTQRSKRTNRTNRTSYLTVSKEDEEEIFDEDNDTPMYDSDFGGERLKASTVSTGLIRRTQRRSTAQKGTRQPTVIRSDIPAAQDEVVPVAAIEPLSECPRLLETMSRGETSKLGEILGADSVAAQELMSMNLFIRGMFRNVIIQVLTKRQVKSHLQNSGRRSSILFSMVQSTRWCPFQTPSAWKSRQTIS